MKTGSCAVCLLLLLATAPLGGQTSPLQWPVPPPGPPRKPAFPHLVIGVAELADLLNAGATVPFDVRGASAYEREHLPGAVSAWRPADEGSGGSERIRALLATRGITGTETLVLYGDPDREAEARFFWLLRWAGCPEVKILEGGLGSWRAARRRMERGSPRRLPVKRRTRPGATPAVDVAWVAGSFGQTGVELLDLRDARGWKEWRTPPTFAAGHIPQSLPFDAEDLLPGDGTWPAAAELRQRLATLGPRPNDPVSLDSTFVVYGEDAQDPRIGLAYLLLTLAGLDARVFPGGWREWSAGGVQPIVRVVSAAEVAALLEPENPGLDRDRRPTGAILIDLRDERDFAIGHLPGALNLPYFYFTSLFVQKMGESWPGANRAAIPLVLYCYGPECTRSRNASAQAASRGFRHVLWFRGGVREWRAEELPLLDSPP